MIVEDSVTKKTRNVIVVTSGGKLFPKLPKPTYEEKADLVEQYVTLANVMPETVQESCDFDANVLARTEVESGIEKDAFSAK
jgi:hypothetical protein